MKWGNNMKMKKMLMVVAATTFATAAFAQVGTVVKETGKAAGQSAQEAGDNVKSAVSTEPHKSVNKAKAHIHKAKAHAHRHRAKAAADAATH
ncbi:MAG: hypothetical protein JWN43_1676 [Gammaproteobacteria bacterium]|nr:hypothetical protein [Gammaproteobacteria bacterium]